jgi:hypothetical protein
MNKTKLVIASLMLGLLTAATAAGAANDNNNGNGGDKVNQGENGNNGNHNGWTKHPAVSVPEPGTLALFAAGAASLGVLALVRRRRGPRL